MPWSGLPLGEGGQVQVMTPQSEKHALTCAILVSTDLGTSVLEN